MKNDHQILSLVYAAKEDLRAADDLIRAYVPFIRSEASRHLSRPCTEQDDEFSIAMIAFHEAISRYERGRGAFLNYASIIIKSRLTDHRRREARHTGHLSLDEEHGDEGGTLGDTVADKTDHIEESVNLAATKKEIEELAAVMADFGISFSDVTENSPKRERTLEACRRAVSYGAETPGLLDELLRTRKLPMAQLVQGSGAERKTLERHRKYILAMLLIRTNGYEIIRGHLRHIISEKEEMSV